MAKKKMKLPARWARYANRYSADLAYWYQPKGLAITTDAVRDRLSILVELEGKNWRECQAKYVKLLHKRGVSKADSQWEGGGAPLARVLKQVFVALGLAWIDGDDKVEISKAGHDFLASKDGKDILSSQALRYQFWNPCIGRASTHSPIKLHPIPFLVRLFHTFGNSGISNEEYALFVAKAKKISDVEEVADRIYEFRELEQEVQTAIIDKCESYMIGGSKRRSIYHTIRLNRTYAYRMWALSNLIQQSDSGGLELTPGSYRGEDRKYLEQYLSDGTYIEFASQKEFFSWMSDPAASPAQQTALDIYVSRGDIESAILLKKEQSSSKQEIEKFKKMMISEKTLEDNLEANLSIISNVVGRKLKLVGRQYETTVGPIDLLAQDKENQQYIVIELKKGRTADKVYGQISRYMGWVRKNLAGGSAVAGVIVAEKIDAKLRAAVDAHDTDVSLVKYSSRISAKLA